ncbi:MAG: Serine/threonine protein kinase [Chthoniobacteraceae bacterium]|nr:Serine/threonine protein kinase [Chthoniobacteraceae bacterium]
MPATLKFDHYEVLTRDDGSPFELGRGAMGITYKAFDTSLRIPVALKVINGTYLDSEVARQRFIREARSAAKLRHRHVASVFHLGIDGDAYFYAMELIDGETVEALTKRQGALSLALALQIADQVARAFNAAQPHGLVHRDIKPANLMLVREDDELVTKVIDFGLAKSCFPEDGVEAAATLSMGGFVGTPHFASPEQLDELEIDVRSDIYSLGITLWYMISGQTPFTGSMAQVMSQHLSKPPPFEKLGPMPAPMAALLARMLEKDPALRPQTPAALRKEIEECSNALRGLSATVSSPIASEENYETLLENFATDAQGAEAEVKFEIGETIGRRYAITGILGESNTGRIFQARDLNGAREVRLLLLNRELLEDPGTLAQIERDVERIGAVQHSNLLQIHALETVGDATFIAMEWTSGFTLVELLRARRELSAEEALKLLPQAANGIDHALASGLTRLDLALHQIFIHFDGQPITKDELLHRPVESWPPFSLKLNPLGITHELSLSATWAGRQTIVGGMAAGAREDENISCRYIQALAAIVYELLGGTISPFALSGHGAQRYTPLATLSEQGNDVLRRALDPTISFATANEFALELAGLGDIEIKRHPSTPGIPAVNRSGDSSAPARRAPGPLRPPGVTPPLTRTAPKKSPAILVGSILAVLLLGAGVYLFVPNQKKADLGDNGHESVEPHDSGPEADPVKPVEPEPPIVPQPPPTRQELLKIAVEEARSLEKSDDHAAAITAWLKTAKEFPEAEIARVELSTFLESLRDRPEEVNAVEFPPLRELITAAARLDIISAMMYLGDALLRAEPANSFNWYAAAAARGQTIAQRRAGLMLSHGVNGAPPDFVKSVYYFQQASEKGDIDAKYYLGECYFHGNGVPQNTKIAAELLSEAVEGNNLFAMDLLGTCYRQGLGVPKNSVKARELFTKASDGGYALAKSNLGVLYMKGEGMAKANPQKAVELFTEAANAGDANGMFNLAQCLEDGGLGIAANKQRAMTLYKKAAELGHRFAADWCRRNAVSFTLNK